MASKKDRRHSGWVSPQFTMPPREAIMEGYDAVTFFYDDWRDWRDGMRHNSDKTMIRYPYFCCADVGAIEKQNKKLKIKEQIRKLKKTIRGKDSISWLEDGV